MEIRQLQYFSVLANELNFSKAAHRLCITQGTLSQQIRQLEYEIGTNLFERTSHSVRLTEAGNELIKYARKTLDAAHECSQVATDLQQGLKGSLNIGVTHSFKYLVRSTVKDFIKKYPGVKLTITYSTATDLLAKLRNRKIDFFVSFKSDTDYMDIESIPLFDSYFAVILRREHPLAERKSLKKEELLRHPVAMPAPGLQSRKAVEQYLGLDLKKMDIAVETNDPNILLELVSSTNLLAITSTLAISYRNDLTYIPLEGINKKMTGAIHRLKNTYCKRSASLFSTMLIESAELERIGNG